MESFSLLKYWRGGGGGASTTTRDSSVAKTTATTIVTAVSPSSSSSDSDNENDDEGPFFDLEFTLPDDDSDNDDDVKEERSIAAIVEDFVNENDFHVEDPSPSESHNEINEGDELMADPNTTMPVSVSPSDELFFKGRRLVPIESSSSSLSSESDAIITKFPVSSILKSATKFRVLMLKFNKPKSNVSEKSKKSEAAAAISSQKEELGHDNNKRQQQPSKFFTVKFKVEEAPLVSLFTRDNSKGSKKSNNDGEISDSTSSVSEDKKFSKDVMQKYLKKVKPFYVRVSKRYGEKLKLSGQLSLPKSGTGSSPAPPSAAEAKSGSETLPETAAEIVALPNSKSQKQGNLHAGLRVVCKHLGKSRSASSSAAAVSPSGSNRRDDSLLQQQDGIQSAILHCKRSFNSSRGKLVVQK